MQNTPYISLADIQTAPMPPGYKTATGLMPHTLRNDLMFRIVFEANPDALKALLCSLLRLNPEDITDLEIANPIRLGDRIGEKTYVLDINILLNKQNKIHLELQVLSQEFWTERSLCYLCRNFDKLNTGDDYDKIKPLIQIDILDFELYKDSKEFYSIYHLANDTTHRIYSSKFALHVLELNKEEYATEEDKAYQLNYWARLFKATTWGEIKMLAQEQNKLQSTVETIYRMNADDYVRAELQAREDNLRLQRSIDNKIQKQVALLAKQADKIAEQSDKIAEQSGKIAEQSDKIAEQSDKIADLSVQLSAREAYIAELEAKLNQQTK